MSDSSTPNRFKTTCPCCETRFNVPVKLAGRSGNCPKCDARIIPIPGTSKVVMEEKRQFGGFLTLFLAIVVIAGFLTTSLGFAFIILLLAIIADNTKRIQ